MAAAPRYAAIDQILRQYGAQDAAGRAAALKLEIAAIEATGNYHSYPEKERRAELQIRCAFEGLVASGWEVIEGSVQWDSDDDYW